MISSMRLDCVCLCIGRRVLRCARDDRDREMRVNAWARI
jgi:hypothetical protein